MKKDRASSDLFQIVIIPINFSATKRIVTADFDSFESYAFWK
jgi:hypothetical protein